MRDIGILLKFRLAFTVVFSAAAGYLLGMPNFILSQFILLVLGGFAIVGSSNALNQIMEIDTDALMDRTKLRPLPAGRMNKSEAYFWAISLAVLGTASLAFLNIPTAVFGIISMLLYVLVYTPMKSKSPMAVLVGAFPGAIPFLLGWVAATGDFGIEAGTLFAIQFLWQFPHFWAIAWVGYDDYAKAGYYLLPSREKNSTATYMSIIYTLFMIFVSMLPAFGLTGSLKLSPPAALIILGLGIYVLRLAIFHHRNPSDSAARALIVSTIVYLPLLQIAYVIDNFLI